MLNRGFSSALVRRSSSVMHRQLTVSPISRGPVINLKAFRSVHFSKAMLSTPGSSPEQNPADSSAKKDVVKMDFDDYDDYEIPKNPHQKMKFYTVNAIRFALAAVAFYCIYLTGTELFPGRMGANSLFSEVFDLLRSNDQVLETVGDGAVAFGRDTGRNTEGRRNHIDSYKYKAVDGTYRLRIRMNIKGSKGQVRVWAEVADDMKKNQFVYLIIQNVRNGRVTTIVDRRDELEANVGGSEDSSSLSRFFFNKK
jgi:hypothetical protein